MPSQPTLMPFASVKTGWKVCAAVSPAAGKGQADLAQVLAGLGKARPSLVHDVIVGERNNLDPGGLQGLGKCDRSVEHEWLDALGVVRGDRRLHVDESEIGGAEDVGHVGE